MFEQILRLVPPPRFTDEEKTRVARLLHIIVITSVIAALAEALVLTFIPSGSRWWVDLSLLAVAPLLLSLYLTHRGLVRLASVAFLLTVWIVMSGACIAEGVFRPSAFTGYIMVILMCGFFFDGRIGFAFAALSVVAALAMALSVDLGVLKFNGPDSPLSIWASQSVLYLVTALIQYLAHDSITRAIERTAQANAELRREAAERQQAEAELNQFFDQSLDMIGVVGMNGYFKRFNAAFEKTFGYSAEELRGLPVVEMIHPDDRESAGIEFLKLSTGSKIADFQHRVLRRDGSVRWVNWRAFVAEPNIFVTARDVTEFKEMAEARKRIELEAQALEVKRDFISVISHEFRTPLAVMITSARLIERYYERLTPEERERHLGVIARQVQQMTEMVDQILLINRVGSDSLSLQPRALNLYDFCRALVEETQSASQRAIELSVERDLESVYMDARLLGHIFKNLLSNAIKYSPPEAPVFFDVTREGDQAIFRVADQGIGILPEDQARVYEPFRRGSNVAGVSGSGLGMTIVKNCVDAHGGRIDYDSETGRGTTFVVRLPLDARRLTRADPMAQPHSPT